MIRAVKMRHIPQRPIRAFGTERNVVSAFIFLRIITDEAQHRDRRAHIVFVVAPVRDTVFHVVTGDGIYRIALGYLRTGAFG